MKDNSLNTADEFTDEDYDKVGEFLSNLYFKVRKEKRQELGGKNYDNLNNDNLQKAIGSNHNAILETTGEWPFDWIWDYPLKNNDKYIVTLIYPWVDEDSIIASAASRFKKNLQIIIQNNYYPDMLNIFDLSTKKHPL